MKILSVLCIFNHFRWCGSVNCKDFVIETITVLNTVRKMYFLRNGFRKNIYYLQIDFSLWFGGINLFLSHQGWGPARLKLQTKNCSSSERGKILLIEFFIFSWFEMRICWTFGPLSIFKYSLQKVPQWKRFYITFSVKRDRRVRIKKFTKYFQRFKIFFLAMLNSSKYEHCPKIFETNSNT